MQIPKDIEQRIVWARTRSDETEPRIGSIAPANPCGCGIKPQREPVYKISETLNPVLHKRVHCDYCKRYSVLGTNLWFDTPQDLNAYLRLSENRHFIECLRPKD